LTEEQRNALSNALANINGSPLHVYDRGGLKISTLKATARRAHRKHGFSLLVVDYVQLVQGVTRRRDRRDLEVGEVTGELKALAKELKVPMIVLSQLNRDYDRNRNRAPQLSDLRDSGSIEQDADVVVFIDAKVDDEGNLGDRAEVQLLVRKNRGGRTGAAQAIFNRPLTRFERYVPSITEATNRN
jgi:replicative DNA helicase